MGMPIICVVSAERIYAREGVALERSTLADWMGRTSALAKQTLQPGKLHADDTPAPVLAPGHGRTRIGRLWVYVRDDRPAGDSAPASVLFHYSATARGSARETICECSGASCRPMTMPVTTALR
jgi:hypothetical protein